MLISARWILIGFALAAASCTTEASGPRVAAEVAAALRDDGSADVIVNLRDATDPQSIARLQAAVLASLGSEFDASHVYRRVPAFSGRLTPAALERLRADPDVSFVQVSGGLSGQLLEAVPAVGADQLHARFGLTGRGVRVAIVDSGVDLTHPDLEGAVVAQHCFTRGSCAPWNFNEGMDATDQHGHGTGTAGTLASRGMRSPPGFAPEAEIVAVKVQDEQNRGQEADLAAGLDWIASNQDELQVDVVTLGMGTDVLFEDPAQCDRVQPALARAVRNLVDLGIIVVASSGNKGSTTSIVAPGCITGVVTAAATYDADVGAQPPGSGTYMASSGAGFDDCRDESTRAGQIACYSNTSPRVDVLVPGGPIVASRLGGGTATLIGTSRAAAALGGIAALLRQCNPKLTGAEFKRVLVETGELRADKADRTFPWVRTVEAARLACPDVVPPPEMPAADGGVTPPVTPPGAGAPSSSGSAGVTTPTGTAGTERSAGSLVGRFAGESQVEPLGEQRPVDSRAASGGRGDADAARPDASESESGAGVAVRGDKVSSCSVHHGVHAHTGWRGWNGWLAALLWMVVSSRRRRARR